MSHSHGDITGRIRLDTLLLGVIGVIVVYMVWIGVSGAPIPEWVYWISTIL